MLYLTFLFYEFTTLKKALILNQKIFFLTFIQNKRFFEGNIPFMRSCMFDLNRWLVAVSFLSFLSVDYVYAKKVHHKKHSHKVEEKETKKTDKKLDEKLGENPSSKPTTPFIGMPIDIDVDAREVYLIDSETGAVLLEKDATQPMHPSSMTKIMTAYLVIQKIKEGVIKPDTILTVSKNGWRVEGSSMFLNLNDQVSVADLLKGLIIQSGNDASVTLAENISGSEAAFAKEMTRVAHEMGATQTHFVNTSGLPVPEHLTTAKDLATISQRVIKDHSDYYPIYSEKEFSYGKIKQGNRNPLLYKNIGCDGIKTGSSSVAGYGMVASCLQDGRRLILVINGLKSMQARANEATKLITWGFRSFVNKEIATQGKVIGDIPVTYGEHDFVTAVVSAKRVITIPKAFESTLKTSIEAFPTVEAPVAAGTVLGKMTITSTALNEPIVIDLVAKAPVERAGLLKYLGQLLASPFKKK